MQFGKVPRPDLIDFVLPEDHPGTSNILAQNGGNGTLHVYIGCAKWNRQDLPGFYPRGTKDELVYYSSQFNSIELNATFYRIFPKDTIQKWHDKTPENFKFFPKVPQLISHLKRLNGVQSVVEEFCDNIRVFGAKLGTVFLQLHDNFKPKEIDRVNHFLEYFPQDIPLAVELRNTEWFSNQEVAQEVYQLFETHGVSNIITDTAGRRDLLHMRLTSPDAFVRFVGANHSSDYNRLDDWFDRIKAWKDQGLQNLYFFVHQNHEKESPYLSATLIERLNNELGCKLMVPNKEYKQGSLNL